MLPHQRFVCGNDVFFWSVTLQRPDHLRGDIFQQGDDHFDGLFQIRAGADAVGGVGVADGDAADDAGRAHQGRLDGGGVVAAALADGFLDRDALLRRQIQRQRW